MKPIPALKAVHPTDEFLVFEVQSHSNPGKTHRVDKSMWYGSGSCSCEQFTCKIQPNLGRGDWSGNYPPWGKIGTTCKHINLVDRFIACQVARQAIQQRQGQKPYSPSEPNL